MSLTVFNSTRPVDSLDYEVVERKGVGHPDTLADGVAEAVSIAYSQHCIANYGAVLHHNLDKVAIIGGLVDLDFGRGDMLHPAKLAINGRMSEDFAGQAIDLRQFQVDAAKAYIKSVLPHIDIENWLQVVTMTNAYSHNPHWYHPRSLDDLPEFKQPYANDTSTCVGYWPLSTTENLALALEGYFYDESGRPKFTYIGQDIKVMAIRAGSDINVTMCVPFIPTETPNVGFYRDGIAHISSALAGVAQNITQGRNNVRLHINTVDKPDKNDYYMLLTGSCIEAGEEGVVGRGNKSRGVISSVRPYSMEAANGKNPVYHVGKVHTVVVDAIARAVSEAFDCSAVVHISTRNGEPLFDPSTLIVDTSKQISKEEIEKVVSAQLAKRDWTHRILNERLLVPKPGGGNKA